MIANHPSTTEQAGTISSHAHKLGDSLLNRVDPGRDTRSEGLEYSNLSGYDLASIWLKASTTLAPSSLTRNAAVLELLLLRLAWDDRVRRTASESVDSQPTLDENVAQFGEVWIDFVRCEARRADHFIQLTAMEFKVLRFFVANPYRVISRNELLDKVWGYHCYPTTRTVDNLILRLRRKLERKPATPVHFQTVHGVGYKFVPC